MVTFSKLIIALLMLLIALPASACFGPKLYLATAAGEDGELLYHLLSIYIKEKTGVESIRVEIGAQETAEGLLRQEKVDLAFQDTASATWDSLMDVDKELFLLTGSRPTTDLQFTTVPRTVIKFDKLFKSEDLRLLRKQVASGVLPATAVRQLFMQRGWI